MQGIGETGSRENIMSLRADEAKTTSSINSKLFGNPRNETEAEALKWAASMIASFQYKNVVFETDSLTLTRMGNGDEVWPMLQPTIAVIHHYLSQVQNWKMSYNPRGRQLTG
ncbi:hypothetical protein Bca101_051120 [Brassica carinata]